MTYQPPNSAHGLTTSVHSDTDLRPGYSAGVSTFQKEGYHTSITTTIPGVFGVSTFQKEGHHTSLAHHTVTKERLARHPLLPAGDMPVLVSSSEYQDGCNCGSKLNVDYLNIMLTYIYQDVKNKDLACSLLTKSSQ